VKLTAIIDCDPGHDDVMAILLGARTLDLRGITTVHGNVALDQTTRNARQTVEFAEITDVPIAAGLPRPLAREPRHAPHVHGESGLDGPKLVPPTVALHAQHAVDFLIAQSHALPDFHLVPIGPLTNIAAALIKDPTLPQRVKQISLMGGSLTFGNMTPASEFNIWCDPEAAHVVFTSGIPIKMVGLNVTHQVLATPEYHAKIRAIGKRTSTNVADMLDFYSARESAFTGLAAGSMHDPLAVTALIEPDILTFEPMHVAVELTGTHTVGMTLCDGRHLGPDFRALRNRSRGLPPNAEVAVAVNAARFWELFLDVLATYP
jgi:inosine-uridine nucleoside N-ribohydrolase